MSEDKRIYTAGFLFRGAKVLLVRKTHPKWQAGMLNAVGGELEPGESLSQCMAREFREEANYSTTAWDAFCVEWGPGYEVTFYRHRLSPDDDFLPPPANDKGEELEWHEASNIKDPVIGNLKWLVPLALDPRPLTSWLRTSGDIRKLVTW